MAEKTQKCLYFYRFFRTRLFEHDTENYTGHLSSLSISIQMQKSSTRNMSCFVLLYITFAFRQFEPLQKWSNHPVISRILLSVIRCLQTWRTRGCHIYLTLFAGIYICCVQYFHNLVELLGTLALGIHIFPYHCQQGHHYHLRPHYRSPMKVFESLLALPRTN